MKGDRLIEFRPALGLEGSEVLDAVAHETCRVRSGAGSDLSSEGGYDGSTYYDDTWEYDGVNWTQGPASGPGPIRVLAGGWKELVITNPDQ